MQWYGVFGNTFPEIYAPQNLDIESKLMALPLLLLVSEIDVILWKWLPFCLNGFQNGGYNSIMYFAIHFLKSEICAPENLYNRVANDGSKPLSF